MTEVMELAGKELKTSVVNHIGVFDNAFVCFFDLVVACGILVPWRGIKPVTPALEMQSFKHWTTREAQKKGLLTQIWSQYICNDNTLLPKHVCHLTQEDH